MGKIKSTKKKTRSAAKEQQFSRVCKCTIHDALVESFHTPTVHTVSSRKFSKCNLQWLIEKCFLSKSAKYVCETCLSHAGKFNKSVCGEEDKTNSTDTEQAASSSSSDSVLSDSHSLEPSIDDICQKISKCNDSDMVQILSSVSKKNPKYITNELIKNINSDKCDEQQISSVVSSIGQNMSNRVFLDTKSVLPTYRDLGQLHALDCVDFLNSRPKILIDFISSITNINISDKAQVKKLVPFCMLIEQIYFLRNHNFVGPFSFKNSLVKWSATGSVISQSIDCASSASGGVTTMKRVISNSSQNPNECYDNDVDIFADNTQRIGRTTRVRTNGTTPMDVATNVVFIQSNPPSCIQNNAELAPHKWLSSSTNSTEITNMESELNVEVFRPYRHNFLLDIFNQTFSELERCEFINDHVQKTIDNVDSTCRICQQCEFAYHKIMNKCPSCQHTPQKLPDRSSLYGDVKSFHPLTKPSIKMGEIIGVNPNSKDTIKKVLHNLQEQSGIGTSREWVRCGFDGVPYNIASNMFDKLYSCSECVNEIDVSKTTLQEHDETSHAGNNNVVHNKLFGKILLASGAGHMEINLLRAFFQLCRGFCIEHAAAKLGFKSIKAKDFIANGANHHLTWQILNIVFTAFAQELLWVYFKNIEGECSPESFLNWKERVVNPNYNFVYNLVFNCYVGFKCFRSGIRRNNSSVMLAGRQKLAPLMYIGKHIIYKNIIVKDMKIRVEAPPEVADYIAKNESFSKSGDDLVGEGGDYITEGENRGLKSHLPPGAPTLKSWQQSSRCHSSLENIRNSVFADLKINDPGKDISSVFNFEDEIQMYRAEIRKSKLLFDPFEGKPLTAIDGKQMHPELVNFYHIATENYAKYKNEGPDAELLPLFINESDEAAFNDINNWTIKKIQKQTFLLINELDAETSNLFRKLHSTEIKNQRKDAHIQFYEEVKKTLALSKVTVADD